MANARPSFTDGSGLEVAVWAQAAVGGYADEASASTLPMSFPSPFRKPGPLQIALLRRHITIQQELPETCLPIPSTASSGQLHEPVRIACCVRACQPPPAHKVAPALVPPEC